ncbi:MAG TPA: GtrA family protein [Caulobacteraceae bacterium]|jgi:putative flippase GtrA
MPPAPPIDRPRRPPAAARLLAAWERAPRFVRNAAISLPTFLLDLALLYLLVRRAHVDYLIATTVSFLVANGLGYFLARWLVFAGTRRGVRAGLVYFLAIAALSAFALTPLMWLAVSVLHVEIILARVGAASIVGVGAYLLNLMVNFRVARPRGPPRRIGLRRASDHGVP